MADPLHTWQDQQFKSGSEWQIFEKLFMPTLFVWRLLRESRWYFKKMFCFFKIPCLEQHRLHRFQIAPDCYKWNRKDFFQTKKIFLANFPLICLCISCTCSLISKGFKFSKMSECIDFTKSFQSSEKRREKEKILKKYRQ